MYMYLSKEDSIKCAEILLKLVHILQDIVIVRSENIDSVVEYNDSVVIDDENENT